MSDPIYRRDFIKQGMVTAAALSAVSPAVCASPGSETQEAREELLRCSFCSKSQNEVPKLIAGPAVYICNECVDTCQEILADNVMDEPDHTSPSDSNPICNLCGVVTAPELITIIVDRRALVCRSCIDAILATQASSLTTRQAG